MFTLIYARINDWVNNREAGDFRRHRGHYDVNVMFHGSLSRHAISTQGSNQIQLKMIIVSAAYNQ